MKEGYLCAVDMGKQCSQAKLKSQQQSFAVPTNETATLIQLQPNSETED